ncbi:MAG: phosphate ABC transporter substrate-binding protein [Pseudomonadota bacterium]|nr:phosphate ABC transporter substrate-binding protein [Pseudomonadota bacterium]
MGPGLFGLPALFLMAMLAAYAAPEAQKLVLTGSSTIAPLAAELGQRFEALRPGVEVDVQSGGSSRGIHDAREGLADLGMVSRALTAEEADLHAYTIALDGVALITHRSNPVAALGRAEIIAIYTDRINRWSKIGGPDRPITVVNKAEGRSTLELFLAHFGLRNSEVKPDVVIGDNAQGLKTVAGNPWSIGYVSIGSAEYEATHGEPIRLLPLDGVEASIATVRDGTYPLTRPLNLVARGPASGLALAFIELARSEAARAIVEQQFFVPVDPPVDAQPVDARPVDGQPVDGQPVDGQPVDAPTVDAR